MLDDNERQVIESAVDQLDAVSASLLTLLDEPEPPEPQTQQGCSVNGPAFGKLGYDTIGITRVFLRDLPPGSNWDSVVGQVIDYPIGAEARRNLPAWSPSVRGIPGDSTAANDLADGVAFATAALWLSWKEEDADLVDAFLDTKPDDLGLNVIGTFHHEPEDDAPGFSADKFCSLFREHAPVMRAHGVVPATILMRYTFSDGSGRNWRDWWPGDDYVDVFGCDSYNTGNKKGNYSDPVKQMAPIIDAARSVGKPWGIGETGASVFNGDKQRRVDWMRGIRDVARSNADCLGMCWWDQDSYALDEQAAAEWFAPL